MPESVGPQVFEIELSGCRPEPLASYLKALAVLRLVAEQKDPEACGFWRGECFVLRSRLDRQAIQRFFLEQWIPTPVIAPWNGGSGFYPKDNRDAAESILASNDPRLETFKQTINIGRSFVAARGWSERPADQDKVLLLSTMRATLPDAALAWLDAAVVLGDQRLLFPPLLGTGGNDGRLDFSNNFQQRVLAVLTTPAAMALDSSIFGEVATTRFEGAMGQYQPAANKKTNPWDFVLLIEGALMFASSATRRYESASPSTMAFPFHARAAGGVATVTDSDEEDSRDELWLPLWSSPATIRSVRRLFAEGRATVGSGEHARAASSALDFARAVTALGIDRGVEGFVRVGFHKRNGLAYFATPLGRFATREVRSARLLDDIDEWFNRFRRKSSGKNVPSRVAVASRRLEEAMFEATSADRLGLVLLELGNAEQALGRSLSFAAKAFLGPVPRLSCAWGLAVDNHSTEQRLAAALATRPGMRGRLVAMGGANYEFGRSDSSACVFAERAIVDNLQALLSRESIEAEQQEHPLPKERTRECCSLTDIAKFIDGSVDDSLIERWLRALVLIDEPMQAEVPPDTILPPASFIVLSLAYHRRFRNIVLPRTSGVLALACSGRAEEASAAAIRRLNASALPLPMATIVEPTDRMRRIAAALAFPLTGAQRRSLENMLFPAGDKIGTDATTTESSQEQL